MSKTTRKRIWPVALMSLAVFGVLAAAVVFATMQPQAAQAHECDSSTMSASEYAGCLRDHQVAGIDGTEDHNHPPMAVGSIDAVMVTAGMSSDAMDVSGYFSDGDDDDLTFSAASSDDGIATAEFGTDLFDGPNAMLTITGVAAGDATITVTADDGNGGTAMQEIMVTVSMPEPDAPDMIDNSSTSGGASVRLELTVQNAGELLAGSSVVLYLEDDFQVPDDIDPGDVYFSGVGTGRVYAVDEIEIDDDDHFGGDDDWDIQVFVPDMNPGNDEGFDNWPASSTAPLKLVFTKGAGIKNPTEQGTHSVGYSVLGPDGSVGDPQVKLDDVEGSGAPLATLAKISLSDEDAGRGKEITITGTGFNNGTGAEVYVLVAATKPESCMALVTNDDAESLGTAEVGSDDKFVVTFTVHQDEFDAGEVNYICAADSEAGSPSHGQRRSTGLRPGSRRSRWSPDVGELRRRSDHQAARLHESPFRRSSLGPRTFGRPQRPTNV